MVTSTSPDAVHDSLAQAACYGGSVSAELIDFCIVDSMGGSFFHKAFGTRFAKFLGDSPFESIYPDGTGRLFPFHFRLSLR